MSKVLILAHDFPPIAGGGVTRPVSFAKYLPEFGYEPIVLTRGSTCGRPVDREPLGALPPEVTVARIDPDPDTEWDHIRRRMKWARPVERAIGKPANWLADGVAWRISQRDPLAFINRAWLEPAVALGAELIQRHKPSVLIATGPPFGTLKAGCILSERFNLPLITDYRDPWTYAYLWRPVSDAHAAEEREWERRVIAQSARVLAVTPSMVARLKADYPRFADRMELLTNGYEDMPARAPQRAANTRLTIAHIGTIVEERRPKLLFDALTLLRERRPDVAGDFLFRFVGPSEPPLRRDIESHGVGDLVEDLGPMTSTKAKEHMLAADALLVYEFVGTMAIPAKTFEYLAAAKPVLAFVKEESDAAWLLRQTSAARVVAHEELEYVVRVLLDVHRAWRDGTLAADVDANWLGQFHRRTLTKKLAGILDAASAVHISAAC
jgi:glycosyltransferase involved in cell wall biosynthesis